MKRNAERYVAEISPKLIAVSSGATPKGEIG
jgi:hypothetical protein